MAINGSVKGSSKGSALKALRTASGASRLIEEANRCGVALMLFDPEDRVAYSNSINDAFFRHSSFAEHPTYDQVFWDCVRAGHFSDRRTYEKPQEFLVHAKHFRRVHRFAQFTNSYPDGTTFLVTHEVIPGVGSYFSRTDLTERLADSGGFQTFRKEVRSWAATRQGVPSLNFDRFAAALTGDAHGGIHHLSEAGALVGPGGVLLDVNPGMRSILERRDGLSIRNGCLRAGDREEQIELIRGIGSVLKDGGAGDRPETILRVGRPDGLPYLVRVIACDGWTGAKPVVMVVVADPDEAPLVQPSTLERLFGLTWAESRLAVAVGRGEDLARIALRNGVSVSTVRNQMQSVYAKTGVSRQADLALLMTSLKRILKFRSAEIN